MDSIAGIIFLIFGALLVFLISRELVCWYFKLNQISQKLDEVLIELKKAKINNS